MHQMKPKGLTHADWGESFRVELWNYVQPLLRSGYALPSRKMLAEKFGRSPHVLHRQLMLCLAERGVVLCRINRHRLAVREMPE